MPSLFIYSIGPVQDFIATAKRCRDLWFGSWLLSELAKAAARAVATFPGVAPGALIFPHVGDLADLDPGSPMSVANKIVAQLPEGVSPNECADTCHAQVLARLRALRDQALGSLNPDARAHLLRGLADQQLDDVIEELWVSVPLTESYQETRRAAERLLSSAKHTRLWQARPWPTTYTPKSSLDGTRESVINESVYREHPSRNAPLRRELELDEGERLCGVSMLKRHGRRGLRGDEHRFFSTPHLASLPLLSRMQALDPAARARIQTLWDQYLKALANHKADLRETVPARCHHPILKGHDGQLLFESRVTERFEHLTETDRRDALKAVLPALRALLAELGASTTPLPYIAIIVADGDRMGDAINRQDSADRHRQLSRALDDFSRGARNLVSSHEGELIYAGGDDVLAFVPLHRAIECARGLRDAFVAALHPFGDGKHESPTLSVGIGVCHFMEPMTRSLAVARDAETLAKHDRDSLAIIVDRRSGAPVSACGSWKQNFDRSLEKLVQLYLEDAIPDKLAHDLAALNQLQRGATGEARDALAAIAQHEFLQVFRRKRSHGGTRPLAKETLENFDTQHAPQLASQLAVAKILAQAQQAANPTEPRS